MAEIPQERDFLTWSIQNFVTKVKQFVRKYYITWLIDQFNSLHINIWLSSLNIFDKSQFCEMKKRHIYSLSLWLMLCKKGKNEMNKQ